MLYLHSLLFKVLSTNTKLIKIKLFLRIPLCLNELKLGGGLFFVLFSSPHTPLKMWHLESTYPVLVILNSQEQEESYCF